jgi:hypothetical protein
MGRGLVDYIHIEPSDVTDHEDAGGQPTGHCHTDGCVEVVTQASSRVAEEPVDKWRYEGVLGVEAMGDVGDLPIRGSFQSRVSYEHDYLAVSGIARGSIELLQGNTVLSAFLGGGHDRVDPDEPPPGQQALWPATHQRVGGGVALTQLLSPSILASGGIALTHQAGALESPYRRARVRTTLFPEAVPETRDRFTAFGELLWYLGLGTSLRARQGFYADTWGVLSSIPQIEVAKEIGSDVLLFGSYRYYHQLPASLYAPSYSNIEEEMSSDPRLGEVREHMPGAAVSWQAIGDRDAFGALSLETSYQVSFMSYVSAGASVIGHVIGLAALVSY